MIYLDTSAAVKAFVDEQGSQRMRRMMGSETAFISSRLLAVEVGAVVIRRGADPEQAELLLSRVALVAIDDSVVDRAIALRSGLRTLDSLHLATAIGLGDIVTGFISYDDELTAAAARAKMPVL